MARDLGAEGKDSLREVDVSVFLLSYVRDVSVQHCKGAKDAIIKTAKKIRL